MSPGFRLFYFFLFVLIVVLIPFFLVFHGSLHLRVYLPVISDLLQTENPTGLGWLVVLGMSLVPFVFGQALRVIQKARGYE